MRTKHLGLDDPTSSEAHQPARCPIPNVIRISGIEMPQFPLHRIFPAVRVDEIGDGGHGTLLIWQLTSRIAVLRAGFITGACLLMLSALVGNTFLRSKPARGARKALAKFRPATLHDAGGAAARGAQAALSRG
jgi:hypothetical protein